MKSLALVLLGIACASVTTDSRAAAQTPPIRINRIGTTSVRASCDALVTPVNLSGWVPGTRIFVDGAPVESNYLAASTLLATFPAHRMASPGIMQVTAVRPNGDTSAAVRVEIVDRMVPYPIYGINVSPFTTGDPNIDPRVSEATWESVIPKAARLALWLKFFGATNGFEKAPAIARRYGRKVALVAWIGRNAAANENEIASVIQLYRQGLIDLVIVGSEAVLRGDVTVAQLVAYINRVKSALPPGAPVTTAETYGVYKDNSALRDAVTEIHMNLYPSYWENGPLETGVATIHQRVAELRSLSGNKVVVVGESGHPSAGPTRGVAVPSVRNAAYFIQNLHSWAQATGTRTFLFELVDEPFHEKYENAPGIRWGLLDVNFVFKPGMCDSFEGRFVADNWSGNQLIGGPGTPSLHLESVPPRGVAGLVKGRVAHVRPAEYRIALLLRVGSLGFWSKPTFAQPWVTIQPDGSFEANIFTGGSDLAEGDRVVAILIPATYTPPLVRGATVIPNELATFPQAQATR